MADICGRLQQVISDKRYLANCGRSAAATSFRLSDASTQARQKNRFFKGNSFEQHRVQKTFVIGTFGVLISCSPVPKILPTIDDHIPCPDDHQDCMQPSCPPQHVFFVYFSWPGSLHSEPLIPETDENRLSAHVTGRPRPPRRLQS